MRQTYFIWVPRHIPFSRSYYILGFTLTETVQYCEPLRDVSSIFPAVDFVGS